MSGLLLQTKLFKPTLRPALIARPQLIAKLNASLGDGAQGFNARLTLVSAPAGFGKTTLVSAWLAQLAAFNRRYSSGENVAWLSLDENDNDPVRFLSYLIAALRTVVPDIGQAAVHFLQSPQPPANETILTILINEISQIEFPIILVLDDYHVITTPPLHQALSFLLEHLPRQLHVLINTRSDPPLPLSRLRARGQMLEVRQDDLRFTLDEAKLFFNQVMGLNLASEAMVALEQRTEGWIAGLQLAALSMQGYEDLSSFITALSGSNRYIMDYLTDEVLQQRPSGTKEFLLQTSILNPLCASLCDAVTGRQDGEANLKRLEAANLFISPLDNTGTWFRYHPLFAEVLQARLQQAYHGREYELYHRAAVWHGNQGMIDEAVRYALAGGDFEEAAPLIEGVAGSMLRRGSIFTVMRWLDAMPEKTIRARPYLCLARAWIFQMGPALSLEGADEWAQLALQVAAADGTIDAHLTGEAAAVQAMTAATRIETARSRELARQALDSLPADSPWRSVMTFSLGTTYYLSRQLAEANQLLSEAVTFSQADGAHFIQYSAASFLAEIQVFEGRLSRAMQMFQEVLAWADPNVPQKGVVMAHGGLAQILYERNDLDAALAHVDLGARHIDQVGGAWAAHVIYRVQARIHQARGNWTGALDALDRSFEIGQRTHVSLVSHQAAAMRARLQLDRGDLAAAEEWAAKSGLTLDDDEASHPELDEEPFLSLARVASAQGRHAEALSLLDRMLNGSEAEGRMGSAIAILILQALIRRKQGDLARSVALLERTLNLAEPEGYIRVFVDEGEPMRALLQDYRAHLAARADAAPDESARRLPTYINELLAAFSLTGIRASTQLETQPDALTEREVEVLSLIATGASNQEIANALVIAVPTVKKHVSNILSKLNATSRTQAVAEARALGLLY